MHQEQSPLEAPLAVPWEEPLVVPLVEPLGVPLEALQERKNQPKLVAELESNLISSAELAVTLSLQRLVWLLKQLSRQRVNLHPPLVSLADFRSTIF